MMVHELFFVHQLLRMRRISAETATQGSSRIAEKQQDIKGQRLPSKHDREAPRLQNHERDLADTTIGNFANR